MKKIWKPIQDFFEQEYGSQEKAKIKPQLYFGLVISLTTSTVCLLSAYLFSSLPKIWSYLFFYIAVLGIFAAGFALTSYFFQKKETCQCCKFLKYLFFLISLGLIFLGALPFALLFGILSAFRLIHFCSRPIPNALLLFIVVISSLFIYLFFYMKILFSNLSAYFHKEVLAALGGTVVAIIITKLLIYLGVKIKRLPEKEYLEMKKNFYILGYAIATLIAAAVNILKLEICFQIFYDFSTLEAEFIAAMTSGYNQAFVICIACEELYSKWKAKNTVEAVKGSSSTEYPAVHRKLSISQQPQRSKRKHPN